MKSITASQLEANIIKYLDEVLNTGVSLEIIKEGKKLQITPVDKVDKLKNLISRPNVINGNPDELVNISWEKEIKIDIS